MKVNLTEKEIAKQIKKLGDQDVLLTDTVQPGLTLRLRPRGGHSYRVQLGRGRFLTLGPAAELTPTAARTMAESKRGEQRKFKVGLAEDPMAESRRKKAATFSTYLDEQYEPWALAHLKSGADFVARIRRSFEPLFGAKPIPDITPFAVEKWRSGRLRGKDKVKPQTVNKDLVALKACLSDAVEWGVVKVHPLAGVKRLKEDTKRTVRYLFPDEETKLRDALIARDDRRRAERASANEFRRERKYELWPDYGTCTDHLTPIILLALNTGCRRGELFNLRWRDVDLVGSILTVGGEGAKSGRTRQIPLNDEAAKVLKAWRPDPVDGDALVFPGDDGKRLVTIKTAWLAVVGKKGANLKRFRFHDLRHTFASNLVQHGVDLATVRELLGHSDFQLTLRYAHMAPSNLSAAVAKLNGTR